MKMSWRIFCAAYLVVFFTTAIVCFALVEKNNTYMWNKTKEEALASNETATQLFMLITDDEKLEVSAINSLEKDITGMTIRGENDSFKICTINDTVKYADNSFIDNLKEGQQGYDVIDTKNGPYMRIISFVKRGQDSWYLQTLWDLNEIYEQQKSLKEFCKVAVLIGAFVGGLILLIISHFISVPIRRLSEAANEIASGNYHKRIEDKKCKGGIEVTELSHNFNVMAETVNKKVDDLNAEVKRKEQFLSDFTHELKTPMTTIIGYADMIRSFDLDRDECSQSANTIYREAKRLERLSMQLLELFVMENDKPEMQRIDMESLFGELSLSTRFLAEKYGVDIKYNTENIMVMAEPSLISSLFYNLTDNACKASEKGQSVVITAAKNDGICSISVTDNGRGISEEHIKEVMEPFYMEDKSRSRSQGGAGLGLALCKKIADVHGSTLEIESTLGEGTTVKFTLPLAENEEEMVEWVN